ncbi:MAG: glutamate-1-semialdehyde 2,1-aminomutase [Woeseiaceae bacterium]|nr:glutamate-1-semialdehyde 2,1-aminomutase [Woeseiaceae bacterium]
MALFEEAKKVIAGGVNSPARSFGGVGGDPVFFKSGKGAWVKTEDGRDMIDYVGSWGPLILGHAYSPVINAIKESVNNGLSFGAPTIIETKLANKVREFIPSMERIRMVSTGTEATMSAIRLARGFTKRDVIIKFEGCYHGHSDSLLIKAGSGALTHGVPSSPGIPKSLAKETITLPFNDTQRVKDTFSLMKGKIACVIMEPVTGNMNMIIPSPGFLEAIKEECEASGAILIFDEVMTGFRVAKGGAQSIYNISPDLTTLGKIIGGGLPAAAFGGRQDIMSYLAPEGPVYQAGTLSGNPIAMLAGLVTLESLEEKDFYKSLHNKCDQLMNGMLELANNYDLPLQVNYLGGMFGFTFNENGPIKNFEDITNSDINLFKQFFHGMLAENIYLAPSAFEAGFISSAHTNKEINLTLDATEKVFSLL